MKLKKNNQLICIANLIFVIFVAISGNVRSAAIELPSTENLGIDREDLDVNLNTMYFGARGHAANNNQSELVVQIPFALTKKANETGLGPIAAIIYFDNKDFVRINKSVSAPTLLNPLNFNATRDRATVRGFGRLYYVYSAYDVTHTIVPYVNLYRELLIGYSDGNNNNESKSRSFLPPGIEYAFRKNEEIVLHLDAELFSLNKPNNNVIKVGAAYALADTWLLSGAVERLAWDMEDSVDKNVYIRGTSNSVYLKAINSNPLRNNFSFMLGYAVDRNVAGAGPTPVRSNNNRGFFWGAEITLGTLAW